MATHSSTLAWRIPWAEEPGGLQSMRSAKSQIRPSNFQFRFFTNKIYSIFLFSFHFPPSSSFINRIPQSVLHSLLSHLFPSQQVRVRAEVCKRCPMGRVKLCGAEPLRWDGSWWSPSSAASKSQAGPEPPFLVSQVRLRVFITQVYGGPETETGTELAPGERQQSHRLGPSVPTEAQCRHLGYRDHPARSWGPETNVPGESYFQKHGFSSHGPG